MVVPVAIAAFVGNWLVLPRDDARAGARLDWLGFLSLSAGIAAAQLVFSRGQRLDWFESYRDHRRHPGGRPRALHVLRRTA